MRRLGKFFSGELTAGRLVFWGGLVTLLYAVLSTASIIPTNISRFSNTPI